MVKAKECSICFEKMVGTGSSPGCAHVFHKDCLQGWVQSAGFVAGLDGTPVEFQNNGKCPVCRRNIIEPFVEVILSSDDEDSVSEPANGEQNGNQAGDIGNDRDVEQNAEEENENNERGDLNAGEEANPINPDNNGEEINIEGQENQGLVMGNDGPPAIHDGVPEDPQIVFGQWRPAQNAYVCPVCGRTFPSTGARAQHVPTHDQTIYSCVQCGRQFRFRTSLNRHYRRNPNHALDQVQN